MQQQKIERKMKETIPLTITSEKIQYLKINIPKQIKDMYSENYKMLLKETEEGTCH